MIRILLIGPLPPPMGGNTRHFMTLCEDLEKSEGFELRLINTSRGGHSSPFQNLAMAFRTVLAILRSMRDVDIVSYHASNGGMFLFGPLVNVLSRLGKRPAVLRIFGGSFGDFYERRGRLGKWIIRKLILSSDVVLLPTQRAIRQLQDEASGKLAWFSTYIKPVAPPKGHLSSRGEEEKERCSRFVFLGHLWKAKGIEVMLEAAGRLPGESAIDLYGPLDEYTEDEIRGRGRGRVRYRGFLSHDEVNDTLWEYDCLVLPTFYPSEGYPGVIAEAFAYGLPVISTNWLAIPEIVDDTCGILIEPRDVEAFVSAITALYSDRLRWLQLKEGASIRAKLFDHATWSKQFESICQDLVSTGRKLISSG